MVKLELLLRNKIKYGYIATSTVLVIFVLILTVSATISLLSIGEMQSSLSQSNGENMLYVAEGCLEDALIKSAYDSLYEGGEIQRPEGTCKIIISKNGNLWTLTASTTNVKFGRIIQTKINRDNQIIVISWNEI